MANAAFDVAERDLLRRDDVVVELAAHRGRIGRAGLAAVGHRVQHVVVDGDQRGRVLGEVAAVGDHDRDRLADIGHLAVGERERPQPVERRAGIRVPHHAALHEHRREIVEREHGVDAGQRERLARVNAADQRMRMGAAHERGVQQAWERNVVEIAALADRAAAGPRAAAASRRSWRVPDDVVHELTTTQAVVGRSPLPPWSEATWWGGVGGGGHRLKSKLRREADPPPHPSPARGEGADRARGAI